MCGVNTTLFRRDSGCPRGHRFGLENIQRSSGQVTLFERLHQCGFVDQPTARGIDQVSTFLHLCQFGSADQMARFGGER